jgi:undecaprenyl-diphosphatase
MPVDRHSGRYVTIALLLLALVVAAGFAQRAGLFVPFDQLLIENAGVARNSVFGSAVTQVALFVSAVTSVEGRLILLALLLPMFLARRHWRGWLWLATVSISAMLINTGLKLFFQAARPDIIARLDPIATYSFPSGHAAGNMAFFLGIAMLTGGQARWSGAIVLTLIVGVARIWLAAHWPSDVVCGWIEAAAILMLARLWLPNEAAKV